MFLQKLLFLHGLETLLQDRNHPVASLYDDLDVRPGRRASDFTSPDT